MKSNLIVGGLIAVALCSAAPSRSAGDLARAKELVIRQCSQCHTFEKGEKHGQGPNLFGLIGRPAASVDGFVFSDGLKEALRGKTWTVELLDQWLTDTLAVAPKGQMVYWQDDPAVRARLIDYLESLH